MYPKVISKPLHNSTTVCDAALKRIHGRGAFALVGNRCQETTLCFKRTCGEKNK
jgi:hypothetical protein